MMCKVPTLCCLVFGLIGLVVSQMPIQNIQVQNEDGDDNEMVGAPLLGLGLGLHGIGHGIRHAVSPFGLLNPLRPIGGIHSFRAGNIGPFKYAHSLLGAGNPMENEENMIGQQPPQGPPMINCPFAPQPPQFEQRAPQQFDANLGSPMHDFLAAPQHHMQHPFDMLRPLEHLPMNPMEAFHHFNLGEHARHNMDGIDNVGAQNIFGLGLGHHHHHHHFLEPELGMEQQGPMGPMEFEQGARTWGKKFKGHNSYDDKGYGGYEDKGYGGYEDNDYSKGYDKGYDKGYGGGKGFNKGHGKGHQKGYNSYDSKGYGGGGYSKGYESQGYGGGQSYGGGGYNKGYESQGYGGGQKSGSYGGGGYNSYDSQGYGGGQSSGKGQGYNGYNSQSYGGGGYNPGSYGGGHQISYQDIYRENLRAADGFAVPEPFQMAASEQIISIAPVEAANIEVAPTTVKSLEIESKAPLRRSKRAADVPYTSKRCIEDLLRSGPLLGAANPSMTAKKADCESSSDCETLAEEPKLQVPLAERMAQPYMGFYDEKLWDNKGFLGRMVSPLEHVYFEFVPKKTTKI